MRERKALAGDGGWGRSESRTTKTLAWDRSLCLCRTWWGRRHQESSQEAITIPRPGAGENGHSEHVSKVETDLWKAWGHQRRKGSRGPLFFLTKWQDQVAISQAGESCKKSRFEGDQEFGLTCGLWEPLWAGLEISKRQWLFEPGVWGQAWALWAFQVHC